MVHLFEFTPEVYKHEKGTLHTSIGISDERMEEIIEMIKNIAEEYGNLHPRAHICNSFIAEKCIPQLDSVEEVLMVGWLMGAVCK
jgi:hypothetical protein